MSELADVAETQEKVTDKTEYDYLLNMNLWSLTHEEAEEIKKELQTKKEELDILKATSIESMRNCDLGYNFGTGMLRFDMRSLQPRETLTICSQYAWLAVPLLLCGLLACLSKSTSKAAAKPLRAKETRVATNAPGRMCNSAAWDAKALPLRLPPPKRQGVGEETDDARTRIQMELRRGLDLAAPLLLRRYCLLTLFCP